MASSSNLYPPLVDTYAPSFLINSTNINKNICRIYFSLSLYNDITQIKNAQIIVRYQTNNLSALDSTKYPCEIKLANVEEDNTRTTSDKYYIEISPEDIEGHSFKINQYYKVQIRFTSVNASNVSLSIPQAIDSWLTTNLAHFSEWSTVVLARGISTHSISLNDFASGDVTTEVYANIGGLPIAGTLSFADKEEKDSLKLYRIKLYDSNNQLLRESGDIYTSDYSNINEINYYIGYELIAGQSYYFTIEYETNTLYKDIVRYSIRCVEGSTYDLKTSISAIQDEENGRVKIKISRSENEAYFSGQVIIKRASSKDNFKVWEDLYAENYQDVKKINLIWNDYTVECGVWYQYAVQGVDSTGLRLSMKKYPKKILAIFEDIFLVSDNKQIKIKYNPNINSFKRTLSESKTDTLGSQFPFIRRNGNVNYIQFSLGGLIASTMDEDGLFINKKDEYGSLNSKYNQYNEENYIPFNSIDFIWEKTFRDKIVDFLYDGKPKLFRSPTEGNILIRLMDINFSPNQTLGRQIWSFSATAFEVDKNTLENLIKYNIYTQNENTVIFIPRGGIGPLAPINRVVFVQGEHFPDEGHTQVLYVYQNELYLYDEDRQNYYLIAGLHWNDDPYVESSTPGVVNQLYTDFNTLYQWNNDADRYEAIITPIIGG